ncbi:MAG: N-acetyltransferase [Aquitalea sp.]|nr:N-acetyltransferase [Aquitalea sp.]
MPLQLRHAKIADAAAIAALMLPDSSSQGGTLHGDFPLEKIRHWLEQAMEDDMPVILAEDEAGLLGVLFTSHATRLESPVSAAMALHHQGSTPFYFYGPVCIAPRGRGRGLLATLWQHVRQQLPGHKALLFINASNQASLRAHARLGMQVEGHFDIDGQHCLLLCEP